MKKVSGKFSMKQNFIARMELDLINQVKHNKTSVEKLAATFGITDRTDIKEFTELAIVNSARIIAHSGSNTIAARYAEIVTLYKNQVNLS
ncbi:MAG: hypothetical protein ABI388_03425, partial [Bacteroidia bacterium]